MRMPIERRSQNFGALCFCAMPISCWFLFCGVTLCGRVVNVLRTSEQSSPRFSCKCWKEAQFCLPEPQSAASGKLRLLGKVCKMWMPHSQYHYVDEVCILALCDLIFRRKESKIYIYIYNAIHKYTFFLLLNKLYCRCMNFFGGSLLLRTHLCNCFCLTTCCNLSCPAMICD